MALRIPPGRAGRTWLVRRLEIARRGVDVLEEKRRVLLRERERLEPLVQEAEAAWRKRSAEADGWLERAAVLSGDRRLRLARQAVRAPATVDVRWRNSLGVVVPEPPVLELPPAADVVRIGGSAALPVAADRHREALEAGVRLAALRYAHDAVWRELEQTTLRLRAIERRWIPRHRDALAALSLALDEIEREDLARARWASDNADGPSPLGRSTQRASRSAAA